METIEEQQNVKPYAVLPLRDIVIFPKIIVTLYVGREKSLQAIDYAINSSANKIILVAQKDPSIEDPTNFDLYNYGIIGNILQILKLTDGTLKILVEAENRVKVKKYINSDNYLLCEAEIIDDYADENDIEMLALSRSIKNDFEYYSKHSRKVNPDLQAIVSSNTDALKLSNLVAYNLPISIDEKQRLLEIPFIKQRLEEILKYLSREINLIDAEQKIKSRVKKQMEKTQKEYYLNEQLKAIQNELGDGDDKNEVKILEAQIRKTKLPREAKEKLENELKKLKMMNMMSAEASVIRNYLDTVLALPWNKLTKSKLELDKAQKILERDHYGLEKVKERIIEYLAVQKRTDKLKSPIICLVGPPGVGKTSLAKSIAEATGRNFARISLGGVRDEAEIRGHRKTYIGAMPGKIINALKKSKSSNPVILLDEIDKIGMDFRGDPTSALLEVLDPAQNSTFVDHYVELEFDLSNVMFIATANSTNMPRPLLDRMEMIRLSGYTEEEKVEIAERHLISKVSKEHGIKSGEWKIKREAIVELIRSYTREAGVRNLERELAKITRKSLKEILMNKDVKNITITSENLEKYSGVKRFLQTEVTKADKIAVTNGLAYTEVGGELLYIEAVTFPGKGAVKVTGKLGEVMQESAQAALSFVKSRSLDFGILPSIIKNKDLHIHVPEGATPKDGPSAGVAICTTIVSVLTNIPVRHDIAMTGEITLSGRVLAIGGLKEKLLAAQRSGIKTVLIPEENRKDLAEIPENVKNTLEIIPVERVEKVFEHALIKELVPIASDHPELLAELAPKKPRSGDDLEDYITH
ncbi:MAG: endopeptidase La [Sphingobacteriia bacterium]|nr:endopeptidase La [Sphingobacteriia bacterium]